MASYQKDEQDIIVYMLRLMQGDVGSRSVTAALATQVAKWADGIALPPIVAWHVGDIMKPQMQELPMVRIVDQGITAVDNNVGTGMRRIEYYTLDVMVAICSGGEVVADSGFDSKQLGDVMQRKIQRYRRAILDSLMDAGQMDGCPNCTSFKLTGAAMSGLMPFEANIFFIESGLRFLAESDKLTATEDG